MGTVEPIIMARASVGHMKVRDGRQYMAREYKDGARS
jgi:hypothetical protein